MKNENIIQQVHDIEKACFDNPWSFKSIEAQFNSPDNVMAVKYINEKAVGYVFGNALNCEYELYRIAVLDEYRGRGIGKELILKFVLECRAKAVEKCVIFLEVRAENNAAVSLYKNVGFVEIARRKGYYGDEDALIFQLKIKNIK